MAYQVGERVWVPASRLGLEDEHHSVLYERTVVETEGRSVRVELPGGDWSEKIATSLVHSNVGVALVEIGDFDTEEALLHRMSKSLLQYFRLCFSDDTMVQSVRVRGKEELRLWWQRSGGAVSHVIIIGHGNGEGLKFGVEGWVGADEVVSLFSTDSPVHFVSLACRSGLTGFGRSFSQSDNCADLIAPVGSVHGAAASLFCQAYFAFRFVRGFQTKSAYNRTHSVLPGTTKFRFWRDGKFEGG